MEAGKVETETLTEGDGDALKDDDDVLAHLWIGNGYSQETAFSTYDEKKAELLTVNDQLPEFLAGIRTPRSARGSPSPRRRRRRSARPATPSSGIANKDTVLVIIDLVSKVLDKPEGERDSRPRTGCPSRSSGRA